MTISGLKTSDTSFILGTEFGLAMLQIEDELTELRDQVKERREVKTLFNKMKELIRAGETAAAKAIWQANTVLQSLVSTFPEPTGKENDGPGYYEKVRIFGVEIDPNQNNPVSIAARSIARFVQPTKDVYDQPTLDKFLDTLSEKAEEVSSLLQEDTLTAQVLDQRKQQLFGLRTSLAKSHHDSLMSAINKIA